MQRTISLIIILYSTLFFKSSFSSEYIDKGHYVIDLKLKVEWLKCSIGQKWNNEICEGEPIKLNLKEADEIKLLVREKLGGDWRLPKRKELESLICKKCDNTKIDSAVFPNTPAEPFWTSQRNWWSPRFFWSVNFFTGHSYGRFVPEKKLYIRLVKSR